MDSDEESEDYTQKWKGIAGTIFIINAYDPSNFGTPSIALSAATEVIRNMMRSSNARVVGLCLYGTKESQTSTIALQNVVEILPLEAPTLNNFRMLRDTDIAAFGKAPELKLADIFWHCSRLFSSCKRLLSERTVVMLTRLDVPPVAADQRPTLKRVVDLVNLGIDLKIINISERPYIADAFYLELMRASSKSNDDVKIPKTIWDGKEIQLLMQQHSHRHLATAMIHLEIGEGFSIGVGIYSLCKPHPMPKKVYLDKDTNDLVASHVTTVKVTPEAQPSTSHNNGDSNDNYKEMPILKSEILYTQFYGNEDIGFTHEEMAKLKNPFGTPSIKLLGFKGQNILRKEQWFLKQGSFLFPNESLIEGSTKVFKALHKACTEMNVIGIAMLCSRVNSKPKIVALCPCSKPLGLDIEVGFDIIYMPYLENLKDIPEMEDLEAYDGNDEKLVMKNIIKTVTFDYKADTFENPKLQVMYRAIEALALDEESTEYYSDTTKPSSEKFENINADQFYNVFGSFNLPAPKRRASKETGSAPKRQAIDEPIDEKLLESRLQHRQVHKYNVTDLKHVLRWKNPPNLPALTGVKKDELVRMVYELCKT